MDLLLKNGVVDDPQSPFDGKKVAILVQNGKIKKISQSPPIESTAKVVDLDGAFVSPGWLDIGVQTGEPGYEFREDYRTLAQAAAAGGFTGVACLPNVNPVMDNKSGVSYLKRNSQDLGVEFFPIGAISVGAKGEEITELMDMHHHGAVAFSDGPTGVQHSGLLMRALLYCKSFEGLVLNQPNDIALSKYGQINEGTTSFSLGLKGIPSIAEDLMIQRDITLLEYTGGRLHIGPISTKGGVALIRKAKKEGLSITASTAAINLLLEDETIDGIDSNYKVMPPLRTKADRIALHEGLLDGTIDCVQSHHTPLELEVKRLEFPYASFGAIGLETAFSVAFTAMKNSKKAVKWSSLMSIMPRRVLGLSPVNVREGELANLTFYDTQKKWIVTKEHLYSKSKNTPFLGWELSGKPLGILLGENMFLRR